MFSDVNTTFTLPSANSVPSGSWFQLANAGSAFCEVIGTVSGTVNPPLNDNPLVIVSDGTHWLTTTPDPSMWISIPGFVSYVDEYTFEIYEDKYNVFQLGIRVRAILPSQNCYITGTVNYVELSRDQNHTVFTVIWDSIIADNTVTSFQVSAIQPINRLTSATPLPTNPVNIDTHSQYLGAGSANKVFEMVSDTPKSYTLPDPTTVASGSWYEFINAGFGICTIIGTISSVDNPTISQHQQLKVVSDGEKWLGGNTSNSSGIAAVVDDPTPQLGGDLDCSMRRILNTSVYENMTGDLYFADCEQSPDSIYYNPCVSGGITMSVGSFSVGNYVRASFQTPHSMKLDTQITINLHYILPDENNIGKNHTWELDVMTAGINDEYTIVPGSPFRASKQIAANDSHTHCILPLATLSTENLTMNTKIETRLQRIASADLECESGVCVISVDSIYQADTLGSRTPTEK